ncbi:hypothetical protein Mgra_00006160 [Meloidogyne graminicola]|uniref:Uncharacterized protein n=1 Tax=Meloidogyne graminicola TaxID=189291 RepID=A0A8S9ZMU7_9BILA|nr:hypothetical protein Mgra_00006160 [Meloidogyne graminicola]
MPNIEIGLQYSFIFVVILFFSTFHYFICLFLLTKLKQIKLTKNLNILNEQKTYRTAISLGRIHVSLILFASL